MGFYTEPVHFMETKSGGFINVAGAESAAEIIQAVTAGNFQILPWYGQRRRIIVETQQAYYTGSEGTDPTFQPWTPGTFAVAVDGIDYIVVAPSGEGRTDLDGRLNAAADLNYRMETEAERDPEGAFGGRGNNFV